MGRMEQMKIVVNGDSFTHERHFSVGEDYIEKTWAHKIGAKNLALGSCSNDRIFHSTIEYLNEEHPDILIIGWTDYDRYSMTHISGLNLHITPREVTNDLLYDFNKDEENLAEYKEFYYKKIHNSFLNFKNFLTYYLHLEKYCATYGIKFLNFTVLPMPNDSRLKEISATAYMSREDKDIEKQGIKYNNNILKNKLATFKKENWINNEIGFNYSEQVEHLPKWHDGHPGLEASAFWAEIIKRNLN
jgi:hypothetical protein